MTLHRSFSVALSTDQSLSRSQPLSCRTAWLGAIALAAALSWSVGALAAPTRAVAACPAIPQPASFENPAYYAFVHAYNPECADHTNYGRPFADATIRSVGRRGPKVEVTTSAALAGAIASVRLSGSELIASGGHGSGQQWNFHAWPAGSTASACYSPTQAGSRSDDAGFPPFHGPSTSLIHRFSGESAHAAAASIQPAMYVPQSSPEPGFGGCIAANSQPAIPPYTLGLSPYRLETRTSFGKRQPPGVFHEAATVVVGQESYPRFDGVFITYVLRDLDRILTFNPATGRLKEIGSDTASHRPMLRCDQTLSRCLGLYFRPQTIPGGYYYARTDPPSVENGMAGGSFVQITAPPHGHGISPGTRIDYDLDVIVGTAKQAQRALEALVDKARRATRSQSAP
jgi:hypothetical protein